ncbi:MAG: hypothetical protein ACOCV3_01125 [Halanaerobiales bacterium]
MTDKIYYKVQYPMKKAINIIKDIEPSDEQLFKNLSTAEKEKVKDFINEWENHSKSDLKNLIKKLRKE